MQVQVRSNRAWRTPFHYKDDTTGVMQHVVEKFRDGLELAESEKKYLYWYVWQYVDAFEIRPENQYRVKTMAFEDMRSFAVSILPSYGINPF